MLSRSHLVTRFAVLIMLKPAFNQCFYPSNRCYNECREGQCSGSPRFECECSLGWTSDPATLVLSGVECDVDCGCNFHSTCITAPGICDECQGQALISYIKITFDVMVKTASLIFILFLFQIGRLGLIVSTVVPGALVQPWLGEVAVCRVSVTAMATRCKGTVTTTPASATAHTTLRDLTVSPASLVTMETPGVKLLGVIHVALQKYHIQVHNQLSVTMNRNNGTCYRQCQGRSVLLSPASASAMPFSSSLGWRSGAEGKGGLSHCLWVLSVTEKLAPCQPRQLCPPVALTLHPDSHTHCKVSGNICLTTVISSIIFLYKCSFHIFMIFQSSFVYVFDGLPRFLSNGVVHSDHNLIGAFCGTTRAQPITVEATSGNILQI